MSNFYDKPTVGIDVSANFSYVAILAPNGDTYRKSFKIKHDVSGFNYLFKEIKKVKEEFNMKIGIFMESTGVYHLSLFHFLNKNFDNTFVINPLVTNCNKNVDIRKVKNDKKDALSIAKIGKFQNIKLSQCVSLDIFLLKSLVREYYKLTDNASIYKKKLSADLRIIFPNYNTISSNPTCNSSLSILNAYPTPESVLNAPKSEILELLISNSKKGATWAENKYDNSIPGVGRFTAITLIAEIGDINGFIKPKHLVAFFGIDSSVNESGKFKGNQNKMSKRGTRIGRRALYAVALASIRKNRNGVPINSVLLDYYQINLNGKKSKVALRCYYA